MSLDKILVAIAEETKHIKLLTYQGQVDPRLKLESDDFGGFCVLEQTTGLLWAQFDSAGRLVGLTDLLKEHYGPADLSLLVDREAAEAYDFKNMTGLWAEGLVLAAQGVAVLVEVDDFVQQPVLARHRAPPNAFARWASRASSISSFALSRRAVVGAGAGVGGGVGGGENSTGGTTCVNSHPVYVTWAPEEPEEVLWGEWQPMSWCAATDNEEMLYTSGPRTGLVAARVNHEGNWSAFGKGPDEKLSDQVCGHGGETSMDQAKKAAEVWLKAHWKDIGQLPSRTKTHSL